ncbi:hypothetical protein K2Z84_34115 [Candidatus Binatia bacterium]|nr:hypothetical protein [Candidatus Binatia bacterium]
MIRNAIATADEASSLLALVADLHDGCLGEAHLWTEHAIGEDLAMTVGSGWDTWVRLLLQRQGRPLSAVELLFREVRKFVVTPSPRRCESIIVSATLLVREEGIFRADRAGWSPDSADRDLATWVWAGRLSWRDASDWMGSALRYGATAPNQPRG